MADIYDAFGGMPAYVAIMSDKQCRLQEVTTCWHKKADNSVGHQVACPDYVLTSSRNNAILNGCGSVWLDRAKKCQFITKEFLKSVLKARANE